VFELASVTHKSIRPLVPAVLAVAALGSAASTASQPAQLAQPEGAWAEVACPFDTGRALLPVTCGRLRVPENYSNPVRFIEIAVMVVRARRNVDPENPVIFLNGGPGGTSLVFAERLVTAPSIRDMVVDRDWVFFDQRGAGRSTPALYCGGEEQEYLVRISTCRDLMARQGIDLSQYNSARSARDIEALRRALGIRQWNLWGASYGSRLAFTMARDFPSSVRSIIHDGPDLPEDQEVVDDLVGTAVVLDKLFSKCAADTACVSRFPDLRSRFLAAIPRLRQQPLIAGDERFDDSRTLYFVRDWLFGGFYSTFERRVQGVLAYVDAAARGDGPLMLQIEQRMTAEEATQRRAAREEPNEAAPFPVPFPEQGRHHLGLSLSIDCNEEKAFESMEEYARAAAGSEIVRALLGPQVGLGVFQACALWPSGRADPIENRHVDYDGPQLAFTGELDASLSGLAGYRIAMLYAHATNVVFRNAAHLQVNMEDSSPARDYNYYRPCALRLARTFLADPRRRLDTRCAETMELRLVE
jgi:pimeloyl-ACP methyl ester carboxylesterase